jgi:long-chain acyl-CoA synthetase
MHDDARHAMLAKGEATLPQLLLEHARQRGGRIALREKEHGIWKGTTWAGYLQKARHAALGFMKLGLVRGDRIVIASEDVPAWFFADLGAQMIGVQVVGIYPTNPWVELQYIARHWRDIARRRSRSPAIRSRPTRCSMQ